MRSDEDLDPEQMAYGRSCEAMLSSGAWNRAHTSTYRGLVARLEMLAANGLPPMRVLSAAKLEALGRIPRSDEGHQEDALAVVKRCGADGDFNSPKAVLLFYSHRWCRPNWCEALRLEAAWGAVANQGFLSFLSCQSTGV